MSKYYVKTPICRIIIIIIILPLFYMCVRKIVSIFKMSCKCLSDYK